MHPRPESGMIMPAGFPSRCWAALSMKWPTLTLLDAQTAQMIIAGSVEAYVRTGHPLFGDETQIPPPPEAVAQYIGELASAVDPEEFMDHYRMRGWCIGDTSRKMKDWRAAVRLWHRRQPRFAAIQRGAGPSQGSASLFALQAQKKTVEDQLEAILYPAGSQWKVQPVGDSLTRFNRLHGQREAILARIDAFAAPV